MQKHLFPLFVVAMCVLIVTCSIAQAPTRIAEVVPTLPDVFTVTEQPSLFVHTFKVEADNNTQTLGTIEEQVNFVTTFRYLDNTGALVATAEEQPLNWGYTIAVSDARGKHIGTIKEQVFSSLLGLGVTNIFTILDANGAKIAESDKFQFLDTTFSLKDNTGKGVATLHRPAFNLFYDQWSANIANHAAIDSRLLVMIAAFKTAEDNRDD